MSSEVAEQTYGIGQIVKVGNVEYTVNSISQVASVGNEYLGKTAK